MGGRLQNSSQRGKGPVEAARITIAEMPPDVALAPGDFWVFAYGSLMWQPGFDYIRAEPARLQGRHRAFCLRSIHYRGTAENPGLVLGLAPGGSCIGRAFSVSAAARLNTIAYLRERELISYVYLESLVPIHLMESGTNVHALTYIADQHSPQFAGDMAIDQQAQIIANARGSSGPNVDYLRHTLHAMAGLGLRPGRLGTLLRKVDQLIDQPQRE
jgi:cation transport protein ChaC